MNVTLKLIQVAAGQVLFGNHESKPDVSFATTREAWEDAGAPLHIELIVGRIEAEGFSPLEIGDLDTTAPSPTITNSGVYL